MLIKLMMLLLMLMVFTGCSKFEPNPYTTIIRQIIKYDDTGGSSEN